MKAPFILACTCAAALVLPLSSCTSQKTAGAETAEPVAAGGEIPPWIAESADPTYESSHYKPVAGGAESYAYNPPSKPAVNKKTSGKKTTAKTSSSSRKNLAKKTSKPSSRSYTVKKGDTLGAIARRNGTSVKALKKANGLKSDMIHINQKLTVPRSK